MRNIYLVISFLLTLFVVGCSSGHWKREDYNILSDKTFVLRSISFSGRSIRRSLNDRFNDKNFIVDMLNAIPFNSIQETFQNKLGIRVDTKDIENLLQSNNPPIYYDKGPQKADRFKDLAVYWYTHRSTNTLKLENIDPNKNYIDLYYTAVETVNGLTVTYFIGVFANSKEISYYYYTLPKPRFGDEWRVYVVKSDEEAKNTIEEVIKSTGTYLFQNIEEGNPRLLYPFFPYDNTGK